MSEECPERDLEAIHRQVGRWFDGFIHSPQYEPLTETQRNDAPDVIRFFTEYSFRYIGVAPEEWNADALIECCVGIMPAKMAAERAYFQAVAPVLSAFFIFLADKDLLGNARILAETVAEMDRVIVSASQDERNWGAAKAFAMAAQKAGVNLCDQKATRQFLALHNLQLLARQRPAPQAPFLPAASLPAATTPMRRSEPKVGRNDPCLCGSGKKFKKCCGA